METIEMTETQRTGIREVLILKSERLMFSVHMLEMRLKQATMKLQELVTNKTLLDRELEQMEVHLAAMPEGARRDKEQDSAQIQKLAYKIYLIKAQIENLLVKVLFDLPLAVALEKAQLQVLEKFLEDGPIKPFEI